MGEVYRARDTKLKRDVAIKILPDEFSRDADRVSRFHREAEVLASLNHPNIAAIYDVQEADGSRFLILELIEGETLADRIARGPIPVEETLDIAKNICEALEAAHEKGIVHRDLKPANVKITPEGKVKVLDFGLAKALEVAPAQTASNSPTLLSAAAMSGGVVLGTPGYMSPEQAKGQAADQRSDIFSFGCVLYEMLTGRQTFHAETVAETLAAILMREPDLNVLPPNLHPKIEDLVRRCLAKNRKERWHAVADLRFEIAAIMADPHGLNLPNNRGLARRPHWQWALLVVATVVLTAALTAAVVWNMRPSPSAGPIRFSLVLPQDQRFTNPGRHLIAMSPDGTSIVYVANQQLYLRKLSEIEARPIPGTSANIVDTPFFSPDGRSVGFFADGKLEKIAITGSSAVEVCDSISNPYGAFWALDDEIYLGQGPKGILRVSANRGSKPETVVSVKSDEMAHGPQVLPGGDALLFTLATGSDPWDNAQIVVQSLKSNERHVLISGGSDARYVATGHIIYALSERLLAVPFDLRNLQVAGDSTPILEDVMRARAGVTGTAHFSFSNNGYMAYIPAIGALNDRTLALIDRAGTQKPLDIPPGPYNHPRISSNGKELAVHKEEVVNRIRGLLSGGDIWIFDLTGAAAPRRLTFTGRNNSPIWTLDGERIVFASERDGSIGLFSQRADTPGSAELLMKFEQRMSLKPETWSPDGTLLFTASPGEAARVWMLSPGAGQKPTPLMPTYATNAKFSPDGRWVAYTSDSSGRQEVFVKAFPLTAAMHQISYGGGHVPIWSPDGKQLFYATDERADRGQFEVGGTSQIISVDIQTQPNFVVGKTTPLPVKGIVSNQARDGFDITPDGKYFVVLLPRPQDPGKASPEQINIILNWLDELKQHVAVR
jgi:serine/threonine-protein kinase